MSPDHPSLQSYVIFCELHGEEALAADRRRFLTDRIETLFPSRCQPFKAGWFILSDLPVSVIRDNLSPYLSDEDRLCVACLGGSCAWHRFDAQDVRWLEDHL